MGKNGLFIVIFLFMAVLDSSDASFSRNRKLDSAASNDSSTAAQNPMLPPPPPVLDGKKLNATPPVETEKPKSSTKSNTSDVDSKDMNSNNATVSGDSTLKKETAKKKSDEIKEKGEDTSRPDLVSSESCKGKRNCTNSKETLIACIMGSKELTILVLNEGERSLKVNVTAYPASMTNGLSPLEIPSHQSEKVNVTSPVEKITKIILNAEDGACVLEMGSPETGKNFLKQFSFYSKQVTPIYIAYFAFLVALVLGGTWACCSFRKRRLDSGVPYQELEMGLPESSTAVDVDATDGWDQDWDDDWGEDKAVTSPGGLHASSISVNGLTSRTTKKDGWDD